MRFWTRLCAVWWDLWKRSYPKGQVQAVKSEFQLVITRLGRYFWKRLKAVVLEVWSRWAWVLHLSSQTLSLSDAKTVGQFLRGKTRDGVWTESRITMVTANLLIFIFLSTSSLSSPLSCSPSDSSSPSVGVMSGAHRALPMIYAMTCHRWRIAALLPDVSHKTNCDGWQLPDRVWVLWGVELSFRVDGYDARVGGCVCGGCGCCKK